MMFNILHWRSTGLLPILFCLDTLSQWCNAECICPREIYPNFPLMTDVKTGTSLELSCCIYQVLGYNSDNASIKWTYEGKALNQSDSSLQSTIACGLQKMQFKKAKKSDEGNYTCTVTTPEGQTGSFSIFVEVHAAEPFKEAPKQLSITGCNAKPCEVYASEKQSMNFTCKAQVGKQNGGHAPPTLAWSLFRQKQFIRDFPPASTVDGSGTISESLVIDSVTQEDFGTYQCKVTTHYGASNATFNLLPEDKSMATSVLIMICIITFVVVALCGLYCWWRCRWRFSLWKMKLYSRLPLHDDYLHDVFIVHGNSVSEWVWDVLIPTLETRHSYVCFIPDRDILAGERIEETISYRMSKSRRVLVVLTPCLLESQWDVWALHQGIHTCLTSSTSITAVSLLDLGEDNMTSESTGLRKTIQTVKKIRVPKPCGVKEARKNAPKTILSTALEKLRVICLGNPETRFWQKLRLRLGLPVVEALSIATDIVSVKAQGNEDN